MAIYTEEKIQKLLREKNLKATDHRVMIISFITKNKTQTTLTFLQEKLNEIVNIDQATIYRNLNSLIKAKIIRKYSHNKNKPSYEICEGEASSIFICDVCKAEQIFKADTNTKSYLKNINKKANKIKGFEAEYVEIHGICKACK